MKLSEAKKWVNLYFEFNFEAYSWAVEGYITKKDIKNLDSETIINLGEDLAYQIRSSH